MKISKSLIITIVITLLIYTIIIGSFGLLGNNIQLIMLFIVTKVLPILGILFGYFLAIFIPIRITQAINHNTTLRDNFTQDKKLEQYSKEKKQIQEKILKALNENDVV